MGELTLQNRAIGGAAIVFLLLLTLDLVRRNKLSEQYSVTWIAVELAVLLLLIFDPILMLVMRAIGAINAASAFFLLGFIFAIAILLNLTVKLSGLTEKMRAINQELALLRERSDPETGAKRHGEGD